MGDSRLWTLFLYLFLGYSPPGNAFSVTGERLTGGIGDLARIRCSLSPSNLIIEYIEWIHVVRGRRNIVYFDRIRENGYSKNRGKFVGRNVTGQFSNNHSSHVLIIDKPLVTDRGLYICEIKPKLHTTHKEANINLTLVAPPDKPPAITDTKGVHYGTSNCSDLLTIPFVRIEPDKAFVCTVGGSAPYPAVEWHYEGKSKIHNMSLSSKYQSRGTFVKSARQQIDIRSISSNNTLICTTRAPNAKSGRTEKTTICIRLGRYVDDDRPMSMLLFIIPLVAILVTWIVLLRKARVLKHKADNKQRIGTKEKYKRASLVFRLGLILTFGHICIGLIIVCGTVAACAGNFSVEGPTETHERRPRHAFLIVLFIYFAFRFLFDIYGVIANRMSELATTNQRAEKLNEGIEFGVVMFLGGPGFFLVTTYLCVKCSKKRERQEADGDDVVHAVSPLTSGSEMTVDIRTGKREGHRLPRLVWQGVFIIDTGTTMTYLLVSIWISIEGKCHPKDWPFALMMFVEYICCICWLTMCVFIMIMETRQAKRDAKDKIERKAFCDAGPAPKAMKIAHVPELNVTAVQAQVSTSVEEHEQALQNPIENSEESQMVEEILAGIHDPEVRDYIFGVVGMDPKFLALLKDKEQSRQTQSISPP